MLRLAAVVGDQRPALGLATPIAMILVLNRLAGPDVPADIARMVMMLCLGLLATLRARSRAARAAQPPDGARWRPPRRQPERRGPAPRAVTVSLFRAHGFGIIAEQLRQLDVLRGFPTGQLPALVVDVAFALLFLATTFAPTTLGLVAMAGVAFVPGVSLAARASVGWR